MAINKPAPKLPKGAHKDHLAGGKFKPVGGLPTGSDSSSDKPAPNQPKGK
jgi:hypothetical protein